MTYSYSLYDMVLQTPFPCPYIPLAPTEAAPDVMVGYGAVPMEIHDAVAADDTWTMGYCWQAAPGRFLLKTGQRAGRFLAEAGSRVTVDLNPGAEDERIVFHLLHSVMAAVVRQRGLLPFHANAVVAPSGAVVISGRSGAGKSTTIAALLQKGCGMIADDVSVLSLGESGAVEVLPGISQMHLWDDAAGRLGLDIKGAPPHPLRRRKAAVSAPVCNSEPLPLKAVYLLECDDVKHVYVTPLTGSEKFAALQECVYGPMLPGEHPGQFKLFSTAADLLEVYRITRPDDRWTVDEVTEAILNG